jgi:hypothetical protein
MTLPDSSEMVPRGNLALPRSGMGTATGNTLGSLKHRLGRRGLIVLGVLVVAAGLALNWSWLVAIGVAPLLLTALPCVAMCALGLCMMPKGGNAPANPEADDAHPENTAPPAKRPADG